jgi:hypothetical protein
VGNPQIEADIQRRFVTRGGTTYEMNVAKIGGGNVRWLEDDVPNPILSDLTK